MDEKDHTTALRYQLLNDYDPGDTYRKLYRGAVPCPCCKRVTSRKYKDAPCRDCVNLLDFALKSKALGDGITGDYVYFEVPAHNLSASYSIPEKLRHDPKQYRSGKLVYFSEVDYPDYNSKTLLPYWQRLLQALHVAGVPPSNMVGTVKYDNTAHTTVTVRRETAIRLLDLYSYMGEMMQAVHRRGKSAGQNWIAGLIEGDLDPDKFLR